MTTSPPLTRYLGKAERTLQALLQTQLKAANFTFPEWTVLTFLSGGEPLDQERLVHALENGHVLDRPSAIGLIEAMAVSALIRDDQGGYRITEGALERYRPLRERVATITSELVEGIPDEDMDATRRTLDTVALRAAERLELSS